MVIVKKSHHSEHEEHSSAWKLAFADLMVCLMCVFLVLWALEIANKEDREEIINYFRTGQLSIQSDAAFKNQSSLNPIQLLATGKDNQQDIKDTVNTALIQGEYNTQEELQLLMDRLNEHIEALSANDHIVIEIIPDGLRIVLTDSYNNKMFDLGGSHLTPFYEDLLLEFSSVFNRVENGIVITGHTDAVQFKQQNVSNWELSTQRANAARRTMEVGGLIKENITQVIGLANTKPIDEVDTINSINRRIEVIVLTRDAVTKMDGIYASKNSQLKAKILARKSSAVNLALKNQPVTVNQVLN